MIRYFPKRAEVNRGSVARQLEREEELREAVRRAWGDYKAASSGERVERLKVYLEALRRFTKAVNPRSDAL